MRVIFLDIDGVLNSGASFIYWSARAKAGDLPLDGMHSWERWCPICTSNYVYMTKQLPSDVKVVISSTWRMGRTVDDLRALFTRRGLDPSRIIGKTPTKDGPRGDEIQLWLDDHKDVTDFAILDDDSDMAHLMGKLVKTQFRVGLTLIEVAEVWRRFGCSK